jgi:hypothetical protein
MKTVYAFAVAAAVVANAQNLADLPQCAQAAFISELSASGCNVDFKCACNYKTFTSDVADKVKIACPSVEDQKKVLKLSIDTCKQYGVTITPPPGAPSLDDSSSSAPAAAPSAAPSVVRSVDASEASAAPSSAPSAAASAPSAASSSTEETPSASEEPSANASSEPEAFTGGAASLAAKGISAVVAAVAVAFYIL